MAANRQSAAVIRENGEPEGTPRTTAAARVREVWDRRLRQSEREQILAIAGRRTDIADLAWSQLSENQQRSILIALRDLVQLGNEAAYALGYSRRYG